MYGGWPIRPFNVLLDPSTREDHLLINHERGALAKKEVRQALDLAIDELSIVDTVTFGVGTVANSYIPAGALYYYKDNLKRPYDPAKAKEMLAAAGASDLTLQYNVEAGNEVDEQIAVLKAAEQLVPHKTAKGFTRLVWELIPGRQNHVLDARVYARAAAALAGVDRFTESDWTRREEILGATRLEDRPAEPLPARPEPPAPNPAPPPVRRPRWIVPRGNWLGGR